MSSKPYNGHPSWNAWNVSLWIGNEEPIYRLALWCLSKTKTIRGATNLFIQEIGVSRTPDGAKYSFRSVYHALKGLKED